LGGDLRDNSEPSDTNADSSEASALSDDADRRHDDHQPVPFNEADIASLPTATTFPRKRDRPQVTRRVRTKPLERQAKTGLDGLLPCRLDLRWTRTPVPLSLMALTDCDRFYAT